MGIKLNTLMKCHRLMDHPCRLLDITFGRAEVFILVTVTGFVILA